MMVVFSEGVSYNRTVRLYSVCAKSFMSVNASGHIATSDAEDGFENLILSSWDYNKMTIYAPLSKRYVCFDNKWKLVALKRLRKDGRCSFAENLDTVHSSFHSTIDKRRYIGFTKNGRQFRKLGRVNEVQLRECIRFTKLDPSFNPKVHNDYLSGRVNSLLSSASSQHHQAHHQYNYSQSDIINNNHVLNNAANINNHNNNKNINNINKEYNLNNNGAKINGGKRKERPNRRIRHGRQHKKRRGSLPAVGRVP